MPLHTTAFSPAHRASRHPRPARVGLLVAAAALTATAAGAADAGQQLTAAASGQQSAPGAGGPPLGTSAYAAATPLTAPSAATPELAQSSLQERAAEQRQADVERLRAEERRRAELERRRAQERAEARAKARAEAAREAAERARKARAAAEARADRARRAPAWVAPVGGYRISARFGQGGNLWSHRHTGLDFAAPSGNAVRSVGAGVVESAGWAGAYGNQIVVRHRDGTRTSYSHLSAFTRRSGTVTAGTVIGRVGTTGNSTGPHLHLEVRPGGGSPVDPARWLERRGVRL